MFGEHFYHKQIRNTVIAFGTIFNNIHIKRLDSSGNPLQNIKVPLSYSPREKFIARLEQQASLTGTDSSVTGVQTCALPILSDQGLKVHL